LTAARFFAVPVFAGTLAMMSMVRPDSVRAAEASGSKAGAAVEVRKNVCTHCSVGCTVIAEVENGVWTRQQPAWDSPINRGTHCAKGAAIREVVHAGRRLKYPLKLEGGEWKRISWHQAAPAQGTTWPPAGPPLADVPQQKSGMAAPVPPPESAQKPPFVTVEQARAYLNANDLLACQEAARRMRGAGVPMPDGLIALAALRSDLLQAGQDSR
jgi:hypothetical protein